MYYFDTDILTSDADAIIVPVRCDGKILHSSLHWHVATMLGKEYENEFREDLRKDFLRPGEPTIYMHNDTNILPWIINFPVCGKQGDGVWLTEIVKSFRELVFSLRVTPIRTIAVGKLTEEYSWSIQEDVINKLEQLITLPVEFWLHPPEDEDRKNMKVVAEHAAESLVGMAFKGGGA